MVQPLNKSSNGRMRMAIPSDGEMFEPTQRFLDECGLGVFRTSLRRYTATMPSVPGVEVIFQRTADITAQVEEGNADLGFVGYDRFCEHRLEDGDSLLIMQDLGFGRCELVIGVPDAWVDVSAMADLADLAVEFRESGRELRIATKYPRLVQRFLFHHGANYFTLVPVTGALEAAPAIGYADLIADITASGTTLRENRLGRLSDGTILTSEGCLIGNRRLLRAHPEKLEAAREVIERIEAHRNAGGYQRITANVQGESEEGVAAKVLERPETAGLQGPTVARVFAPDGAPWYAVTVFVRKADLSAVVDHFRAIGGVSVTVSEADYVFGQESRAYRDLLRALELG